MNRRAFLRLAVAAPLVTPSAVQSFSQPSRLESLRMIALRISSAPSIIWRHVRDGVWLGLDVIRDALRLKIQ